MDIRCESCGKLIAKTDQETRVDGVIVIRCRKCSFENVISGSVGEYASKSQYSSS